MFIPRPRTGPCGHSFPLRTVPGTAVVTPSLLLVMSIMTTSSSNGLGFGAATAAVAVSCTVTLNKHCASVRSDPIQCGVCVGEIGRRKLAEANCTSSTEHSFCSHPSPAPAPPSPPPGWPTGAVLEVNSSGCKAINGFYKVAGTAGIKAKYHRDGKEFSTDIMWDKTAKMWTVGVGGFWYAYATKQSRTISNGLERLEGPSANGWFIPRQGPKGSYDGTCDGTPAKSPLPVLLWSDGPPAGARCCTQPGQISEVENVKNGATSPPPKHKKTVVKLRYPTWSYTDASSCDSGKPSANGTRTSVNTTFSQLPIDAASMEVDLQAAALSASTSTIGCCHEQHWCYGHDAPWKHQAIPGCNLSASGCIHGRGQVGYAYGCSLLQHGPPGLAVVDLRGTTYTIDTLKSKCVSIGQTDNSVGSCTFSNNNQTAVVTGNGACGNKALFPLVLKEAG